MLYIYSSIAVYTKYRTPPDMNDTMTYIILREAQPKEEARRVMTPSMVR